MSKIQRTDETWNPTTTLHPDRLEQPLHWRKPRRIFVDSMSDLFHEDVPNEYIAAVFCVMAACPQHTFQILTKRPERLAWWFEWLERMTELVAGAFPDDPLSWRRAHVLTAAFLRAGSQVGATSGDIEDVGWPLPNVWLGVSAEDQATADERFMSLEPLLCQVDLREWLGDCGGCKSTPVRGQPYCPGDHDAIDWLLIGGEHGPRARPCDVRWIRSAVEQCKQAEVPCFVTRLGSRPVEYDGSLGTISKYNPPDSMVMALHDPKGGDPSEWPEDLRVRQYPEVEGR